MMEELTETVYANSLKLSAFLLVIDYSCFCHDDGLEFHVDLWALGMSDLICVNQYDFARKDDLTEIARLKHLYKPGNVLKVQEVEFHVSGDISLHGAKLEFVENKELAEVFSLHVSEIDHLNQKTRENREKIDDAADYLRGFVAERQVLTTKQSDPMAFVTIETERDSVEAIFFPDLYRRFQSMLLIKEEMQFRGHYQTGNGIPKRFIVDFMAPSGNLDYEDLLL